MRYAAALVLLVFAVGGGCAADNSAAECIDAVERRDYDAAVAPCTKAAEQGDASAQSSLGMMYRNGYGVPENDAKAVEWYTKAAEQGLAIAQYNLGSMYFTGEGVPKDFSRAYMWLNLAATDGSADAKRLRDDMPQIMTPEQLAEGQRLSSEWFEKHKDQPRWDGD